MPCGRSMVDDLPTAEHSESGPRAARLLSATLRCDSCGRETTHRILRWDRTSLGTAKRVSGVARCRECRWTHRFETAKGAEVEVQQITSRGSVSVRERIHLLASVPVEVGADLPGSVPPLRVYRIDLRSGGSARTAVAESVGTVWVGPHVAPSVPVSIQEGSRTRTVRWTVDPGVEVGVGDTVEIAGERIHVVALRAGGRTWRREGDRFSASRVERLYGRRSVSPPAGRTDWSHGRARPSSRTRSFSRSGRSRSGPGVIRTRTVPRAWIAAGGATLQSVVPP